jgi:hypothetical protein
MGARARVAADQTPMGRSTLLVVTRDEGGRETEREVPQPDPRVIDIVHFVDLDDGRRITTEEFGDISLDLGGPCDETLLRYEVREAIFGEEMREIPEFAAGPRWEDMIEALHRAGVEADESALAALPFVVQLDEQLVARAAEGRLSS